ncbi:Flavodoxin [Caloramator fervidus]|uniref:Flavodoxin n=1 Tax=Caloramator fervidus TaxID=29344 RepID=A0A1H5SP50_9CLOT|nr:EFR1 family ferrodoxin [Caloramator fervidus]SEF52349.1 Flavodoxin [Caloramator fervidus]
MKAAIIYFSGTGNTEYVCKLFKKYFEENGVSCVLIDVSKKKQLNDDYDFYIFGAPIHSELFPKNYVDWVKQNIKQGDKKCIIFSTQASDKAAGPFEIFNILKEKGYKVLIQDFISMPNNYYVVAFKKPTEEDIKKAKQEADKKVKLLVKKFLDDEINIVKVSKFRFKLAKIVYKMFYEYSKGWAKRNLSVDMKLCVKCLKCVKNCPTKNIKFSNDKFEFQNKCISCQKCLHACPTNAYIYKGKRIDQYKI